MHFGKLLKALYEARGFTQATLSEASGLSHTSIHRGIASAKCPWRRSAAIDVLHALEGRAPLSEGDAASYLQLANLEAIAAQGKTAMEGLRRERDSAVREVAASSYAYTSAKEPRRSLAHTLLEKMMEATSVEQVLDHLHGMAVSMRVTLPGDSAPPGIWTHSTGPMDFGGGVRGEILTPIPVASPRPAAPKAQPKRRTGA